MSDSAKTPAVVEPTQSLGRRSTLARLLTFGANASSTAPLEVIYRHRLLLRATHWINALIIVFMLMSGLQIFNAHPALYFGLQSDFAHPVLSLTAQTTTSGELKGITQIGWWHFDTTGLFGASNVNGQRVARGFPAWATVPGPQWLAMGRRYHFFFAWFFVANGILFVLWAILSQHFQRELLPTTEDVRALPHEIADHARLKFAHDARALRYNPLQRLTYFLVIFVLAPLIVLTGLTMSPTMDSVFPFLPWLFGGRQTARMIHFLCALAFVLFFVVHIVMVVLSGTLNNLRGIITGRFAIEKESSHG
jgi:thiosulfate reductase cytochrome b subunit